MTVFYFCVLGKYNNISLLYIFRMWNDFPTFHLLISCHIHLKAKRRSRVAHRRRVQSVEHPSACDCRLRIMKRRCERSRRESTLSPLLISMLFYTELKSSRLDTCRLPRVWIYPIHARHRLHANLFTVQMHATPSQSKLIGLPANHS